MGNYWSDYSGNDTDDDGMGDTPYRINSDKDNYPLMQSWQNYFPEENQPPIASFSYSPAHPGVNQTVAFNALDSYDLDGTIISYEWDFGEGTNGTGEIVEHSYSSAGNYTVNFTVTDDSNSENYTSFIIPVRPSLSKTVNMDAVEAFYPLYHAAKDKFFNMKKDSI